MGSSVQWSKNQSKKQARKGMIATHSGPFQFAVFILKPGLIDFIHAGTSGKTRGRIMLTPLVLRIRYGPFVGLYSNSAHSLWHWLKVLVHCGLQCGSSTHLYSFTSCIIECSYCPLTSHWFFSVAFYLFLYIYCDTIQRFIATIYGALLCVQPVYTGAYGLMSVFVCMYTQPI